MTSANVVESCLPWEFNIEWVTGGPVTFHYGVMGRRGPCISSMCRTRSNGPGCNGWNQIGCHPKMGRAVV